MMRRQPDPPASTGDQEGVRPGVAPSGPGGHAEVVDDPYADLESVFDEPIVLEDADLQTFETVEEEPPAGGPPSEEPGPAPEGGISASGLLARLEALEGEVRAGSQRTLEALRRLGERVGTELAMLDKRAINLELTIARLRSVLEGSGPAPRRLPEPPPDSSTETQAPEGG